MIKIKLTTKDPELMKIPEVASWITECSKLIEEELNRIYKEPEQCLFPKRKLKSTSDPK